MTDLIDFTQFVTTVIGLFVGGVASLVGVYVKSQNKISELHSKMASIDVEIRNVKEQIQDHKHETNDLKKSIKHIESLLTDIRILIEQKTK